MHKVIWTELTLAVKSTENLNFPILTFSDDKLWRFSASGQQSSFKKV